MFQADRWAVAFTELCGKDLDEGLEAARVFIACAEGIRGRVSGTPTAVRVETMLRGAVKQAGFGPDNRGVELAVRFLAYLIRKDYFKHRQILLNEIERAANRMKGITRVKVETPGPLTADFKEKLITALKSRTGAREIILESRIVPELIAGYRVFIGSNLLDTSLREQMRNLGSDLGLPRHDGADGLDGGLVEGLVEGLIVGDDLMEASWGNV
jgi:hypothetical protein